MVEITKSLIQETQKQMFNILEHSLQKSYATLTLETPVKAKEQSAKYINNDNIVILTSNNEDTLPADDWNEEESDWNIDGVQPTVLPPSVLPATTSPDNTTPKVVATTASSSNFEVLHLPVQTQAALIMYPA